MSYPVIFILFKFTREESFGVGMVSVADRFSDFHPSPLLLSPAVDNQKQQQLSSIHSEPPEHLHQKLQISSESISQWFQYLVSIFSLFCLYRSFRVPFTL